MAFASGSAATVTILSMYKTGDHVITIDDVYGGTNRFFSRISAVNSGIIYEFVDMSVEGALEKAFKPNTKVKEDLFFFQKIDLDFFQSWFGLKHQRIRI